MNVIDLDELKKYLGDGITIKKTYMASYEYDKKLIGLMIELNGTYNNLFIPMSKCEVFRPGYAHNILKNKHPFGKRFLYVESIFLYLFTPMEEGMYI